MNNLQEIIDAYESKNLELLKSFAKPSTRELNRSLDFRTAMMLSSHKIEHLLKIEKLEVDAIILNLEDGVSKEEKPFALVLCAIFLSHHKVCDKKLIVRVNALDNGGYDEIMYLNSFMPDTIRVPKIRDKKEVLRVCEILDKNIELHLSIETKEAFLNLETLRVDSRVRAFYLGILDLFVELGLSQDHIKVDNPTINYILSRFLVTTKALGVKPISFVFQDHKNVPELKRWLELEKMIGFDAKGSISPTQAKIIQEAFAFDEVKIKRAKEIVKLYEEYKKQGVSGFDTKDYGFVDEPVYKDALILLSKT